MRAKLNRGGPKIDNGRDDIESFYCFRPLLHIFFFKFHAFAYESSENILFVLGRGDLCIPLGPSSISLCVHSVLEKTESLYMSDCKHKFNFPPKKLSKNLVFRVLFFSPLRVN